MPQIGCLRRRMTIRTNPPGAVAFVDDQRIGVTPVSTPFTYYGTRKIQLFKDGFEPLTVKQRFDVPWYEYPPLDFIVENLWPHELRDERIVDFEMTPQQIVPNEELLGRAEMLRGNAQAGHTTPLWTAPADQIQPGTPVQPTLNQLPPPGSVR
ncbi:MAG: PEGA domain-containing protein [Planctomycetaceae bacterium]|nr:PEGA domain-containing protein [Planctomycetaceae bacterium]